MSVTSRARSATRFGVKVQRRIVIAQALWWPTLILTGAAIAIGTVVGVKRRRAAAPAQPIPRTPVAASGPNTLDGWGGKN